MLAVAILLTASIASGQTFVRVPTPFEELKQFLELTDAQVGQMLRNLEEHRRTLASYEQRVEELRRDIAVETAREHPSSAELGTRYVEVEINCRLMAEEGAKLQARNQALLTAAQKTKLQVLVEAIRLMPIMAQAQGASLLEAVSGYRISTTRIPVITPNGVSEAVLTIPPSPVCGVGTVTFSGR